MSVLIRGMEMPTSCNACMFDVYGLCLINKNIEGKDELTRSCPLVPVPPNGDLVDRGEAIIDANERAYDFWLSDDEVNATIQFLKEQTTIIPASEEGE